MIIHWDSTDMWFIENNFVDMIITSPPYDSLRNYNWSLEWDYEVFKKIAQECFRVLKKSWVLVWDGIICYKFCNQSRCCSKEKMIQLIKENNFKMVNGWDWMNSSLILVPIQKFIDISFEIY